MFKNFAADALGLSDIGKIISSKDYDKVDADDYIMHEDGEKIFFLIKSRTDEYCFTNLALIHVDGESAISKKRAVKRYDYYKNKLSNITIETAGTIDLDCEIKFAINQEMFLIDVDKRAIEQLKDLYKALIRIEQITENNETMLIKSGEVLEIASKACGSQKIENGDLAEIFKNINEYSFQWIKQSREEYIKKDFTDTFKNYINN
ncbi:PH domain-containing protein [Clostridium gasigenes]|uniref:PH domain-containing protein n=1 Tax=Clostridium gasigenes TaxID=94869 RepID=UPI00162ABAA4|nr:PH domain-containing protein [Clostridium gasigenes]MBB6624852.1 PH domain-containing protein [Clostridium gasigenes]